MLHRSWLAVALLLPALTHAQADPVAGDWTFRMDSDPTPQRVALTADGDSVAGRVYGYPFTGTLRGDALAFDVSGYAWTGTLDGDRLEGWIVTDGDSSRWAGDRYRAPAAPRSFDHAPKTYHRLLSTRPEPALRIFPGDTVRTSSVDAGGWGAASTNRRDPRETSGGNPLTGPFVVEGTLPGDILVVHLHRVRLNRAWAFSGNTLMPLVLDRAYLRAQEAQGRLTAWVLDPDTQTARLAEPTPALAAYQTPLTPFLGAIGVAPGGGTAVSTRDSGPFGGNMEVSLMREGATVYLPVQAEGAYLSLGDGHAAQGDGELTGDALETSMDITFSVEVQRYRFRDVPRVETPEALASVGIAGSLDAAIRDATSDLARWLADDYGLSETETALVLGTALAYDVPDMVGPWVSVVARLPTEALARIVRD